MHPYTVIVCDQISQKAILSIPCAESETAVLVQKNLQSLFPQAMVSLQVSNLGSKSSANYAMAERVNIAESSIVSLRQNPKVNSEHDFAELEEDLFNDVA